MSRIKTRIKTYGLLIALAVAAPAYADTPDLVKEKGCLNCHSLTQDNAMPAPSFKTIATKHHGAGSAEIKRLEDVVTTGSTDAPKYHWGAGNMMAPASARVPVRQDEAAQLVRWVLSQ